MNKFTLFIVSGKIDRVMLSSVGRRTSTGYDQRARTRSIENAFGIDWFGVPGLLNIPGLADKEAGTKFGYLEL